MDLQSVPTGEDNPFIVLIFTSTTPNFSVQSFAFRANQAPNPKVMTVQKIVLSSTSMSNPRDVNGGVLITHSISLKNFKSIARSFSPLQVSSPSLGGIDLLLHNKFEAFLDRSRDEGESSLAVVKPHQ